MNLCKCLGFAIFSSYILHAFACSCGKPALGTRKKRIVGGTKVEAGSYPWQVSLWNTRSNKHFCGGSLVAERWVVTAAHCVTSGIGLRDIEVRLGKLFTNRRERGREQIIRPDRIVIHPQYSSDHPIDYDSDIALIHLSRSAVYTDYVKPICLPLRKNDADRLLLRPGNIGVITGWGSRSESGQTPLRRLYEVNVPIVSQTICKKAHQRYDVTSNMFCAGRYNGTLGDACQGDTGGPLAIENSRDDDKRWVLAGVISWGDGCGRIGKYGVYTRVSVFARWINDQINGACSCGKPALGTRKKRIVGGTKVEAGSYPWQVSLWNTRSNKHLCGGSLVAERWVVTAAQCFIVGIGLRDIEVRLGKLFIDRRERGREQIIRPDRIVIHPQFSSVHPIDYDSDIALIHLSQSAVFTDYVQPICLPLRKNDADRLLLRPGNIGVITGWGKKREYYRPETVRRMHEVNLPIVSQTICKIAHQRYAVTSNMFCAGHYNGTLGDACQGDSGGPLAIDNSREDDQRWVLAGVISWGDGCGRIGKYGVYTRVSVFARWINDQINGDD